MDHNSLIEAHNNKVAAAVPKVEACLCDIRGCASCNCVYNYHCRGDLGWQEDHDYITKHKCRSSHKDKSSFFKGSTCLNKDCSGARLVLSSWCASCFVKYKTSKGKPVNVDELTPLPRAFYKKDAAIAKSKVLPVIIDEVVEPDHYSISRAIAAYAGF